ncbi:BZ3500_MvSof-1268-A1-R1_Chr5-2g07772 [Microbotryum saponariae]|uniref:BZ3500_MvSof-1268-A1-R1_Chr5-2g07772 protein n=1 Tax=Microbotryum saponariae TaxID=289078 RepID=A0A2X0LFE1_9BASI|nr:BZ3500_MvSof-1268-A1-R1_Chr5-2g07772 [Microbotryum saponariae]SDA05641.1 BZ3501_MvSof-1269-A2-R1_Chr5-2g07594 [Microbotryum saponariae]
MRTLCAIAFQPHKPIESESHALGRVKRVMYSCFGAPEDRNKKKYRGGGRQRECMQIDLCQGRRQRMTR